MNTTLAAALAGVTPRTIRRWINQGTLSADRQGRAWVIEADSLARHITRRADTTDWQPHQVASATELIAEAAIIPHARRGAFTAVSSDGTEFYACTPTSCTCQAAQHKTRCYHSLAAHFLTGPHALAA